MSALATETLIVAVESLREADASASFAPLSDPKERKVLLARKEEAWELVNAEIMKAKRICRET